MNTFTAHHFTRVEDIDPKDVTAWAAVITAVVGGFAWIWKQVIRPGGQLVADLGKMPGRIATMQTKQEEILMLVYASRARSRALLDGLEHPVWESDANGECVFCNAAMLRTLGRPFTDIQGNNWRSIIAPAERKQVEEEWDAAIENRRDFYLDYHWICADDSLLHVHVRGVRIFHEGAVYGWLGHARLLNPFKKEVAA